MCGIQQEYYWEKSIYLWCLEWGSSRVGLGLNNQPEESEFPFALLLASLEENKVTALKDNNYWLDLPKPAFLH